MIVGVFRAVGVALLLGLTSACAQPDNADGGGTERVQTEQLTIDTLNGPVRFTVEIAQHVYRQHYIGRADPPPGRPFREPAQDPFSRAFPHHPSDLHLIGTYSVNLSTFELLVLLGSGILGYFFRKLKYDLAPFILALIIGPTLEETFRQSLMRSGGSFSIFWERPITVVFIAISLLLLFWNLYKGIRVGEKAAKSGAP